MNISSAHPETAAILLAMPLFRELESDTEEKLFAMLERRVLPPDAPIVFEDQEADYLFILVRGEVNVRIKDRLVAILEAPQVLGLLATIDGERRSASLTAQSKSELLVISRADLLELMQSSPALNRNIIRSFAAEVRKLYAQIGETQRHFDDFFLSPNAQLVPGPYIADPSDFYVFVMREDRTKLARLLPPGLSLIPGLEDKYFLIFGFYPRIFSKNPAGAGHAFASNESTWFVPCLAPNYKPSVFCPELYPDNFLAITLGRELYGFPKRFGQTLLSKQHIDLVIQNRMILRAAWQSRAALDPRTFAERVSTVISGHSVLPKPFSLLLGLFFDVVTHHADPARLPTVSVLLRKQIPDAISEQERVLQIDQLVEIPFHVTALSDFSELVEARVQLRDAAYFFGGDCLGAFCFHIGFGFGKGRTWIDYAQTTAPLSRLMQRWKRG